MKSSMFGKYPKWTKYWYWSESWIIKIRIRNLLKIGRKKKKTMYWSNVSYARKPMEKSVGLRDFAFWLQYFVLKGVF